MNVDGYIDSREGKQREILLFFHDLLTSELNLTPKIRYSIPFYYSRSWICYLNPDKKGGVELAFVRGNELSNQSGILDDKGRKQVLSIHIEAIEEAPLDEIRVVLHEAILLDETTPYKSKRTKQ